MVSSVIERLNERRDAATSDSEDAGFTLIELMVVLLILAILLAIAIPTFLGVTKSANDRASQSNLSTTYTDAQSAFQNNQQVWPGTATLSASLASAENNLAFSTGAVLSSASPSTISVYVATDGNGVILASQAKSGNCWYIISNVQTESVANGGTAYTNVPAAQLVAGTWYGEAQNKTAVPTCNASAIPATSAGSPTSFQGSSFPNL